MNTTPNNIHDVNNDNEYERKDLILVVPRRFTKRAYSIALKSDIVPRKWHLEGQYGSITHAVNEKMGFPLTQTHTTMNYFKKYQSGHYRDHTESALCETLVDENSSFDDLLKVNGVEIMFKAIDPKLIKIPKLEPIDATFHPEKKVRSKKIISSFRKFLEGISDDGAFASNVSESENINFTFAELFSGIGGFGVALEALGGKCVFASEISKSCIKTYGRNIKTLPENGVSGDIWTVKGEDIPHHDLLVGGFPCQPFSSLGGQPGLSDDKKRPAKITSQMNAVTEDHTPGQVNNDQIGGRGQLYTQIVRVLKECKPKAFILENVQGLLHTDNGNALRTIMGALEEAGYTISTEVCSSRCLTAQSRKRLFIVGLLVEHDETSTSPFEFPFIPDLGFRARDILLTEKEVIDASNEIKFSNCSSPQNNEKEVVNNSPSIFHLTDQQMNQLRNRSKAWKPAKLAWGEKVCDTIDSHYGNSVGKGHSQLVPSNAPFHPRRFTPRECARLMGFGESFIIEKRKVAKIDKEDDTHVEQGPLAYIKEQYRMFGNAVCPPIIAALAGALLARCKKIQGYAYHDWVEFGTMTACQLAFESISPQRRVLVRDRLRAEFSWEESF